MFEGYSKQKMYIPRIQQTENACIQDTENRKCIYPGYSKQKMYISRIQYSENVCIQGTA